MNAVIFIIALSVVLTLLFHFSGIDMNTVVKISNFGALSTYVMLNVSVIVFCWFQLKQRKGAKAVFMHLVFPALGALVCFAILMSVGTVALVTGVVHPHRHRLLPGADPRAASPDQPGVTPGWLTAPLVDDLNDLNGP